MLKWFDRFAKRVSEWFSRVSIVAIALILCLSAVDIVGSKLFSWPLPGSIDLIGLFLVLASAFGIAQAEIFERHIRIDFFTARLPKRLRSFCSATSAAISFALWVLVIWGSVKYAVILQGSKEGSSTILIPYFPFALAVALGSVSLALVILGKLFDSISRIKNVEAEK
jgi:TRAP-type C4-dicarboxylate transport system permease small subunit